VIPKTENSAIAAQRDAYRSIYDTGLAKLLTVIWGGNLRASALKVVPA
jgi:hypothetical protein